MKTSLSVLLLALLLSSVHGEPALTISGDHYVSPVFDPSLELLATTKFDFYVLAQSWQPQFCHGKESVYPGCKAPQPFWRSHFTMHGMWPELNKGKHPDFCAGEPFNPMLIEDTIGIETLMEYWPDVKVDAGSPEYSDFWRHEWIRHGTCSGLSQVSYFSHAVDLIRNGSAPTPALIQENVGKIVSAEKLRASFEANEVVLKCAPGNVLSQIFTCWQKDANSIPTARRPCPDHILREDNCKGVTVLVPAFPA